MSPIETPGDLQWSVLRALWRCGELTVNAMQETLLRDEERDLAPTTIATVLQRMEKKGMVAHRTEGRQFVYRALVAEGEIRRSMVDDLAEKVFDGNVAEFAMHLLSRREIRPGDLDRIKAMIAEREGEEGRRG